MKIQFKKLNETAIQPTTGSEYAAGYDLYSIEEYTLMPMERKLFKLGVSIAIPPGMYGRIAPRSGLAVKDGIDVMAGVLDEDYRGELGVLLINLGIHEKKVVVGDKIAQVIFEFYNKVEFELVSDLPTTIRGDGGFGSTDLKKLDDILVNIPKQNSFDAVKSAVEANRIIDKYIKFGGIPVKDKYTEELKKYNESV